MQVSMTHIDTTEYDVYRPTEMSIDVVKADTCVGLTNDAVQPSMLSDRYR